MDDRTKMAFEFASQATVHITTLSTAFLGLLLTFAKDLAQISVEEAWPKLFLYACWACLAISSICGSFVLLKLTGLISKEEGNLMNKESIYDGAVRAFAVVQVAAFALGLSCAVLFVIVTIDTVKASPVVEAD